MKIGERLAALMSERGLSEGELGRRSGVSQPTIHRIVTGESKNPRQDNVEGIAKALGVSAAWLWSGEKTGINNVLPVEPQPKNYYKYPLISSVSAGIGSEVWECLMQEHAEEWLYSTENAGERGFWLTIDGHSMTAPTSPSFPEGTRVLVQPEGFSVINGKYYIAKNREEETTFKRYLRESGKGYLVPLNDDFEMIEMGDEWQLIGRVLDAKPPKGVL